MLVSLACPLPMHHAGYLTLNDVFSYGALMSLTNSQVRCFSTASPCTAGYLTLSEVFTYGALMSVVNLSLWGLVGGAWWAFLGFF